MSQNQDIKLVKNVLEESQNILEKTEAEADKTVQMLKWEFEKDAGDFYRKLFSGDVS